MMGMYCNSVNPNGCAHKYCINVVMYRNTFFTEKKNKKKVFIYSKIVSVIQFWIIELTKVLRQQAALLICS